MKTVLLIFLFSVTSFFNAKTIAQTSIKVKWEQIGPVTLPQYGIDSGRWSANGMGWIESIAVFDKKPRYIYAGSNTGGLYRSKNGGKTWKFVFDVERVCGVTDIVIDDKSPRKIWVATGTTTFDNDWGLGVMFSKNGGKRWNSTGLRFKPSQITPLWCLERSNSEPNIFYACSEETIFKSSDEGITWSTVYKEQPNARLHFRHLSVHKEDARKVVASGDKILTSLDGGNTWTDQSVKMKYHPYHNNYDSLPDRYALALNPANNDQMLVAYEYSGFDYIERSDDFGDTWRLISRASSFNRLDRNHAEISWHPMDSNVIIVGSVRMYLSTDFGKKFTTVTSPTVGAKNEIHDDIRDLLVSSNGSIYVGNDGGVGVSSDLGKTWKNISGKGLSVSQFFDIAVDSGRIVGGCQDLSSMLYVDKKWHHTSSVYGDGGNNLISGNDVYIMQSGTILKGKFDNKSWQHLSVPFYAQRFSYPLMQSPLDSSTFIAADHHLWSYDLKSGSWHKITSSVPQVLTKIVALDLHPSGVAFFAKDQPTWNPEQSGLKERLYRGQIDEKGLWSWTDITNKLGILAWREITSIDIDELNPLKVYVCLYGFDGENGRSKVFRTDDGGMNWTNISEGLPDINCFKILNWNEFLFLATDGGVYFKKSSDSTWTHLKGKMPNVHVTDVEIDKHSGHLVVSTYGAGIWSTSLKKLVDKS